MTFRDVAASLNPAALYIADDLDGGEIPDSSGNSRNPMVLTGATVDTTDKPAAFSQSLVFDGVDDYMETAYEAWLDALHSGGVAHEAYVLVVCRWGHDGNDTQLDSALLVGRNDRWWGIRARPQDTPQTTDAYTRNDTDFRASLHNNILGYVDGWVAMAARYFEGGVGSEGASRQRIDIDGAQVEDADSGGSSIVPGGPAAGLIVGANRTNDLSTLRRWWRGRVAAVLLLDYEPTSQQRLDLAASIHTEPSDFDPANLAATVDGDTVSLSWDASPLVTA